MMSASFGRELADSRFHQLFEEAEHDRLVGCLKRRHRERPAVVRRKVTEPCPQDVG